MNNNLMIFSRNKLSAAIKLGGLIISFSVFIILMSQVWYDVTFDHNHSDSGRIYLFERPQSHSGDKAPYEYLMTRPQIQAIRQASPDVDAVGTIQPSSLIDTDSNEPIDYLPAALVDDDFIRIFKPHIVSGTIDDFDRPESVLLTESAAMVLFGGNGQAIGQQLHMERGDIEEVTVIGVCHDYPVNSFLADVKVFGQLGNLWAGNNDPNYESFEAFVKLRKGAKKDETAPVLAKAFEKNWVLWEKPDTPSDIRKRVVEESRLVTLHSVHYDPFMNGTGSRTRNAILSAIALVFLLVGLLNVFNLSNAEIPFRIQGNCIRRIFGASKSQLLRKDLLHSAILCLVAFGVALLVVKVVSNSSLASFLTVPLKLGRLRPILAVCLVVSLAGSLLDTFLTSRYGQSFAPATVLKGRVSLFGRGKEIRTGTLALQYLLSFLFIIIGLMIGVQNRYVTNYDLGFQTKDIVYAYMGFETAAKMETVREELLKDSDIEDVAFANANILMSDPQLITREVNGVTVRFTGIDVSSNFLDLLGFNVIDGRGFTMDDGTASTGSFVVNEAFMKAYPELSVGSFMKGIRAGYPDTEAQIIGVVRDFNYQDLTHPVEPFAFYCSGEIHPKGNVTPRYFRTVVKTAPGKSGDVTGRLPGILDKIGGKKLANCQTLESRARQYYQGNAGESKLTRVSSILSLSLALLGIFGLIFLEIQTVRKSLAIRKVMGASTNSMTWMMLKKYILLGSVVFVVSIPLGIWIIHHWLEQFSEKAPMPVWIFIMAWILVIGTTAAVICSMSFILARIDPAAELKKE